MYFFHNQFYHFHQHFHHQLTCSIHAEEDEEDETEKVDEGADESTENEADFDFVSEVDFVILGVSFSVVVVIASFCSDEVLLDFRDTVPCTVVENLEAARSLFLRLFLRNKRIKVRSREYMEK